MPSSTTWPGPQPPEASLFIACRACLERPAGQKIPYFTAVPAQERHPGLRSGAGIQNPRRPHRLQSGPRRNDAASPTLWTRLRNALAQPGPCPQARGPRAVCPHFRHGRRPAPSPCLRATQAIDLQEHCGLVHSLGRGLLLLSIFNRTTKTIKTGGRASVADLRAIALAFGICLPGAV